MCIYNSCMIIWLYIYNSCNEWWCPQQRESAPATSRFFFFNRRTLPHLSQRRNWPSFCDNVLKVKQICQPCPWNPCFVDQTMNRMTRNLGKFRHPRIFLLLLQSSSCHHTYCWNPNCCAWNAEILSCQPAAAQTTPWRSLTLASPRTLRWNNGPVSPWVMENSAVETPSEDGDFTPKGRGDHQQNQLWTSTIKNRGGEDWHTHNMGHGSLTDVPSPTGWLM